MLTLQELVEQEQRILIDSSILFSDNPFLQIQIAKEAYRTIRNADNVFVLPENKKEITKKRQILVSRLKRKKGLLKKSSGEVYRDIKEQVNSLESQKKELDRLIKNLKTVELNGFTLYHTFKKIICYLEDTLKIKTNHKDKNNRTDEANIAAALSYAKHGLPVTLLSNDGDFPRLLRYIIRELEQPCYQYVIGDLLKSIRDPEGGIRIYNNLGSSDRKFKPGFDSREYKPKKERLIIKEERRAFVRSNLKSLLTPVPS